jgi:GNAT superfamily N-acetyltransferase
MQELTFDVVDAASQPAQWAMKQYFAELEARFPAGFDPGDGLASAGEAFSPPGGAFILARPGDAVGPDAADSAPMGCGALQQLDSETAEVKRMWVNPSSRGLGVGKQLLVALEEHARNAGYRRIVLDTNGTLTEAIRMYTGQGYVAIARYNDNPYAEHFFAKDLTQSLA